MTIGDQIIKLTLDHAGHEAQRLLQEFWVRHAWPTIRVRKGVTGLATNSCLITQGNWFWAGESTKLLSVASRASASIRTIYILGDCLSLPVTNYMAFYSF